METIEISRANAISAYNRASKEVKEVLETLLGKSNVSEKITDRIKTVEDACAEIGIDLRDVIHSAHSEYLKKDIVSVNAFMKLTVIARALNEGWEPDWSNSRQYKYYPWMKYAPGVGFSYFGYGNVITSSTVGSRICFKNEELAKYAATQFQKEYNEFFNL